MASILILCDIEKKNVSSSEKAKKEDKKDFLVASSYKN